MKSQTTDSPSLADSESNAEYTTGSAMTFLRSGTGAPMFEHGAQTRIRRNPVRAFVALTWDGGPRETFGQVVDVSLTGFLIKTESTIDVGTEVALTVTILNDEDCEYEVRGIIRRATTRGGRQAYGVEFVTSTTDLREAAHALYSATAR